MRNGEIVMFDFSFVFDLVLNLGTAYSKPFSSRFDFVFLVCNKRSYLTSVAGENISAGILDHSRASLRAP